MVTEKCFSLQTGASTLSDVPLNLSEVPRLMHQCAHSRVFTQQAETTEGVDAVKDEAEEETKYEALAGAALAEEDGQQDVDEAIDAVMNEDGEE
jgi:hypothetical protein